jgi:hypothetical protein
MKPLIKLKTTTLLVVPLVLACFALLPRAQAVTPELLPAPAPDGAYTGFNTAEGLNALFNLSTGQFNTALGFAALKADDTGSHNTAVGGQALLNNTSGSYNTAVGENALVFNTMGSFNMALGQGALAKNLTGNGNTAVGFLALNFNTANQSTAVGYQALRSNTIGFNNTANGALALSSNLTGSDNTATGAFALQSNTTGFNNTATGAGALSNNVSGDINTACGGAALAFNTDGSNNTAIGVGALGDNILGSNNTAVGVEAVAFNNGNNNIGLGFEAGTNLATGGNNIDVGNAGVANESNTIRIGNFQTRTFIAGIRGRATAFANAIPVLIDSAGQLGTASSSARFKKEIKPMDKASEAILALKPVTFHYKSDSTGTPQFGLIAEEVAQVNPDLIVRDENGEIYTVRYDAVNAMLLNEFLKAHRRIEEQDKRIGELTAQLKQQAALIQKVSDKVELNRPAPQMAENAQ